MNRSLLPLAFLGAVGLLAALYLSGAGVALRSILDAYVIYYDLPPFGDAYGITSAMACERQGIETYLGNPCHYKPVGFVYPPIWKLLAYLPMDASWTLPLSLFFIASFAIALWFLPLNLTRRGAILSALTVVSPATMMAVNYGNNDMLVFAVVVAAIVALGATGWRNVLGYGLLLLAGLLKFFPFAGLGWSGAERPKVLGQVTAASAFVLAAFVWLAGNQLPLSLSSMVLIPPGSYVFGIKTLSLLATEAKVMGSTGALLFRTALTLALMFAGWRASTRFSQFDLRSTMSETHWRFMIIGALVVVGAYVGNQNLVYRMIFILLILPGLDALRQVPGMRFGRQALIAVFLAYMFPIRLHLMHLFAKDSPPEFFINFAGVLIREALWFAFAVTLLGLIFTHLRSGPSAKAIERRFLH